MTDVRHNSTDISLNKLLNYKYNINYLEIYSLTTLDINSNNQHIKTTHLRVAIKPDWLFKFDKRYGK